MRFFIIAQPRKGAFGLSYDRTLIYFDRLLRKVLALGRSFMRK